MVIPSRASVLCAGRASGGTTPVNGIARVHRACSDIGIAANSAAPYVNARARGFPRCARVDVRSSCAAR
eukprot:7812294-Lingulodinium_polyedra.AAC.1